MGFMRLRSFKEQLIHNDKKQQLALSSGAMSARNVGYSAIRPMYTSIFAVAEVRNRHQFRVCREKA